MAQSRAVAGLFSLVMGTTSLVLASCGSAGPATPTPGQLTPRITPSPSTASSAVTVIAPLGVNFRSAPSTSASVVGVIPQGISLPLVSPKPAAGGWWKVQGATQVGWITSDPQYTSTLMFQIFEGGGNVPWSVMYPDGWTFDQQSSGPVVFSGPQGATLTFYTGPSTAQLPAAAPTGSSQSADTSVEVYGTTASLVRYTDSAAYKASLEFQAQPALALLIEADLPPKSGAAIFKLFLETIFITPAATPSP
ncbi:MAG TPA: SH3 domain-containing protein [Candidatus Dormibacteraeota bacterium]|nr:SH3 domain-containing protein [Candidatus Dormibacteraeota bacterium]